MIYLIFTFLCSRLDGIFIHNKAPALLKSNELLYIML